MAVVGVDIGDYNTFISVARQGGVETIANEYSQRNTPSIVALGDKQRFMGVSAENQRNINVKNTVSFFKNFLGRSFKDPYVQKQLGNVGAEVVELTDGKIGFILGEKTFVPEQILGMMLTKVKEIVKTEQKEDIQTCVISVPLNFTQTQRAAVLDSASLAGLPSVQIINDTSALALAYGKTKSDLPEDPRSARLVVFVDVGCGGLQSCLAAVSKHGASLLASSTSTKTGGKFLDRALLDFTITEIEAKYSCEVRNNRKAVNKLRLAVEKIKKQMSANSTKLPLQIENLCEDLDVNLSLDRAKFEELIQPDLAEVKRTLSILLDSTTVKKEQIDSVELVGGSSRIPAVRQIIQDLFGLQPSYSLNADEGVSKGCGLQAAANSNKFRTKPFNIEEVVTDAIEAVYTHDGVQEKITILDEGEAAKGERTINIKGDLPLHLAVQYGENVNINNRFIALYQLAAEGEEMRNAEVELVFTLSQQGLVTLNRASLLTADESKRRKTCEPDQLPPTQGVAKEAETTRRELDFTVTSLGGLPAQLLSHLTQQERTMVEADLREVARQEAKNCLEENLYKLRSEVTETCSGLESEEAVTNIRAYFEQIEAWLYEEGEDAGEENYRETNKLLQEKVNIFQLWRSKMAEMMAREEARRSQRRPSPGPRPSRQIPVVYEGETPYTRQASARPQSAPFDNLNRQRRPRHVREDPFFNRSSFYNDPLFGW